MEARDKSNSRVGYNELSGRIRAISPDKRDANSNRNRKVQQKREDLSNRKEKSTPPEETKIFLAMPRRRNSVSTHA